MQQDKDDTLSLSFVDCISCGLAAGLFLLIVFAVLPHSISSQSGGAAKAASKIQFVFDDTTGSTFADIEIRVENATFDPFQASWSASDEGRLVFASKARSVTYFHAFPSGISQQAIAFTAPRGKEPPRGFIYLHAGGRSTKTEFDCTGKSASPNGWVLLNKFNMRTRKALGDCIS